MGRAAIDSRRSRVAELGFSGGLALQEIWVVLDVSLATVERDWELARAWPFDALSGRPANDGETLARFSEILHRALEQSLEARQAFLDQERAGDLALREELERLLVAHENAGDSDLALFSNSVRRWRSVPRSGHTGSSHRSASAEWSQGSGRDERLGRDVAIKALPREPTTDPGRPARVEREARALRRSIHPNIATIHGREDHAETRALIMELIDEEMPSSRIEQAPTSRQALRLREVLTIAADRRGARRRA